MTLLILLLAKVLITLYYLVLKLKYVTIAIIIRKI